MVEKDFIFYNIIAIKCGESTHFPGRNDPGRTGNRGETTRIRWLAAVAYVSMVLMESPDDEEGSIAYLFECVFKK
jgi:hypothetical protein